MSQPFTAVDLKHLCVLEIGVCYRKFGNLFLLQLEGSIEHGLIVLKLKQQNLNLMKAWWQN